MPFFVFSLHFFSSTSPTTVIVLTAGPLHALISRAQLIHCWLSKLQSLLIAKHPFCSINLSLTANLSLIIGSWHLWRGGEIDSGGWVQSQRWLFREPIYNDSQQEGALLTFIYKGGPAHHSPEVLFICLANPITLVLIAAGKQLYLHSPCLSGSVSICFWTARWSSLFNFTGSSFGLSPFKETNEFPTDV